MKVCTICRKEKDLNEFYSHPNTLDKRGSQCKSCDTSKVRERNRAKKAKLVALKGGKCMACGYDKCIDALDFHHIDGKDFEIGEAMKFSFDRVLKEVEKCELLCCRCHREIHSEEFGQCPTVALI
jgi:hypothetical protein